MENIFKNDKIKEVSKIYAIKRNGNYSIVDANYELVSILQESTWTYVQTSTENGYFKTRDGLTIHEVVMDFYYGNGFTKKQYNMGMVIDHINNNGSDNRLENLHFIPRGENSLKYQQDKSIKKINDEGIYEVYFLKDHKIDKYHLSIRNNSTGKYQVGIYRNYYELKEDLNKMIDCINKKIKIPFNLDYLKSIVIFEGYSAFGYLKV